jgi:histidine triad (HIT) family protein
MHRDSDCIFCRIVAGDAPCARVHEDALTLTLLDIFPVSRGHTLIITKEHFANVFEASAEALAAVAVISRRVARAINAELAPEGLAVFQLNGIAAGQTIFHYHMHLIPRAPGEAFLLHGRKRASESELQDVATKLAAAVAAGSAEKT